jgi:hypothetical protein
VNRTTIRVGDAQSPRTESIAESLVKPEKRCKIGQYFQENDALTLMSDLSIYGRALTGEEVQSLFKAGKQGSSR